MAKALLKEDGFLDCPELIINQTAEDQMGYLHTMTREIEPSTIRHFERVELEKRLDDIRPDIVAYIDGKPWIIEIAVTSFAGQEKKQRIRALCLPAIEINLRGIDYTTTREDLRNRIHSESTRKTWLSNPKAIEAKGKLAADLEAEINRANATFRRDVADAGAKHVVRTPATLESAKIHKVECAEKTRWFRCESCRDLFQVRQSAAPSHARTIACPNCDHSVSTALPRTRH